MCRAPSHFVRPVKTSSTGCQGRWVSRQAVRGAREGGCDGVGVRRRRGRVGVRLGERRKCLHHSKMCVYGYVYDSEIVCTVFYCTVQYKTIQYIRV